MSSDDEFQKEVEKRVLDLEKISREIFKQIELLKLLLADSPTLTPKHSDVISTETSRNRGEGVAPDCFHYFGYLSFLPRGGSIPDECLSCEKVIECIKHAQ